MTISLNGVTIIEIVQPLSREERARQMAEIKKARQAEIDQLQQKLDSGEAGDENSLRARLQELQAKTDLDDVQLVAEAHTIRAGLRSVTRRQAMYRKLLQDRARDWLIERMDWQEIPNDVTSEALPDDVALDWMAMVNAPTIIAALDYDSCEGWSPPRELIDWINVPDWIFSRLFVEANNLNPHWLTLGGV